MLPKIDVPTYELKLVSSKKPVKFRPFLVKEQKLLLMTQQSNDKKEVLDSVKQIITNCLITNGIDVDELPLFDIEYLFLNLRARSIGEVVNLSYRCVNEVEDDSGEKKRCNGVVKFDLNLLEVKPKISPKHSNRIEINDELGMVMKYPKLNMFGNFEMEDQSKILELIISCIESIYDKETIYYAKDSTQKELEEFVDSLPAKVLEDIKTFFDTMPKLSQDLDFKCKKCGHSEKITIEGLDSFFE